MKKIKTGKIIHIINLIIFIGFSIFFSISLVILGFEDAPAFSIFVFISSLFIIILCLKAFKKCNLNNNFFRTSFVLNILSVIFIILTIIVESLVGLAFLVLATFLILTSAIVFTIGYFEHRIKVGKA